MIEQLLFGIVIQKKKHNVIMNILELYIKYNSHLILQFWVHVHMIKNLNYLMLDQKE